jgi:hypothetical protein
MQEVFVVVQTKTEPPQDVIVAVCATKVRAEKYVATEHRNDHDLFVRVEPVLH